MVVWLRMVAVSHAIAPIKPGAVRALVNRVVSRLVIVGIGGTKGEAEPEVVVTAAAMPPLPASPISIPSVPDILDRRRLLTDDRRRFLR
jgi:hypothetical protein